MNRIARAHLAIIGANLIYGINYSVAKEVMTHDIIPSALTLVRITGAVLLFWLFGFLTGKETIERKDIVRLIIAAFFGVSLNQFLFLQGLSRTTPVDASIIMTLNPVLVLVVAYFLIRSPITLRKILGIILGASGAAILILYSGQLTLGAQYMTGNILVLVNAFSYAMYLVLVKPLMLKYRPFTVLKWVFLTGMVLVLPATIPGVIHTEWAQMDQKALLSIAYVVVGTTFLTYLLNIYALRTVRPITVSIYIYSQPLVAALISIIAGQDSLTFHKVLAALLVFFGVYFVSTPVVPLEKNGINR